MSSLFLKRVALSFLRAFAVSLLVFATGFLQAPNWNDARAAWVAALIGALTAGVRAIQHLVEA